MQTKNEYSIVSMMRELKMKVKGGGGGVIIGNSIV